MKKEAADDKITEEIIAGTARQCLENQKAGQKHKTATPNGTGANGRMTCAIFSLFGENEDGDIFGMRSAPGEDIILTKWIGLDGTALLARAYEDSLKKRFPAWLVEEGSSFDRFTSVLPEAEIALDFGAGGLYAAGEGGILAALWRWAKKSGVGFTINLRKLPIRQETVEICEYLGADPYHLLSGGCLLITTKDGPGLAEALERKGIPARMVGKVTDSHDRLLLNGDVVRYLDRPREDEIQKFLPLGGGNMPE